MQYITLLDYLLLPFVLMVVYGFAYKFRNKHYPPKHPYRKYFIPALTTKIVGGLVMGLLIFYTYGGGDTFNFYAQGKVINSALDDSLTKWFNLILRIPTVNSLEYHKYISQLYWYTDTSSYMVARLSAIGGVFLFNTYLPVTVIFAIIAFSGSWSLFRAFMLIYPKYVRQVAVAVLFVPTVVLWGSGLSKDALCLGALGWLTAATFNLLILKRINFKNIFLFIVSVYVTYLVKVYILLAFMPALFMWVLFLYTRHIHSFSVRVVVNILVFAIIIVGAYGMFSILGNDILGTYSLERIADTAEGTRAWIMYSSGEDGSAYDLGAINTPLDMLSKLPAAVNVSLYRPYLWEVRKPLQLFSALEALLFLFITLKVIFSVGARKIWKTILNDPNLQFCLIFTIIFAFAVGISTGNFGTLSRYRIPCIPFFTLLLLVIYYKNKQKPLLKSLYI